MTDEIQNKKIEIRDSKAETGSSVLVEEQPAIDNGQSSIPESSPLPSVKPKPSMNLPLLLEVGCEEIPARFLRDAEKALGERVQAALLQAGLIGPETATKKSRAAKVRTYSTPRRLVVHVPALKAQQPDKVEEILGPPIKVAVDAEGHYTRAAESFAQKNSAHVEDLARTTTQKGEYLSLRKTTPGRPASEILAEILPGAILGLSFPKSMYWTEKSAPRFVRPIRWIVAVLGEGKSATTVDFAILGVKTGNFTFGHRAKSSRPIPVSGFRNYTKKLAQNLVEVDYNQRNDRVIQGALAVVDPAAGKIVQDEWLVDWIANSTEWPLPMLGSFDARFLHLPREILITVMRDHQRYFAVENEQGNLRPHFVAVLNMASDEKGLIRQGHQRVLTARFRDAEFFWTADQKIPLRDRVPLLDKVTYQAKLGSYGDKVRRMKNFATKLFGRLDMGNAGLASPGRESVLRAMHLCKCDLTTQMVHEFTELQGLVGGLYARVQGEPEEVVAAVYDHYLPSGPEGELPRSIIGALVSLADKLDTVVGGFLAGLDPTGSRDPFALRRAGNGIIKVLVEFLLPITIPDMILASMETYERDWKVGGDLDRIADFLRERLKFYLETVGGFRHDTIQAVMAIGSGFPIEALKRARSIENIRDTDDYLALAAAAKRTRNILRKSASGEDYLRGTLNPDLFQEEAEVELHNAYASIFDLAIKERAIAQDYDTILMLTARLRPAIDKFFNQVLVMHEDPAIRKNRLLLLALLDKQVFSRVGDLSEIGANDDAARGR
jgi:glycyl-tRNA synthetase beta chain